MFALKSEKLQPQNSKTSIKSRSSLYQKSINFIIEERRVFRAQTSALNSKPCSKLMIL
jgi:hypothetical protein